AREETGRDAPAQGASSRIFGWLGTSRQPGALVLFCSDTLVMRVAGRPLSSTVKAPVRWRLGPITMPEATPVATPALSPLVMGMVVPMLCAGAPAKRIVGTLGTAIGPAAMLGYGIGTGPAGDGVR